MSIGDNVQDPAVQAAETSNVGQVSVQRNLAANFVGFGYTIFASIVAVPFYVRALGTEAYGLIGFYTVLVATFQVFDFGLSVTFARECARYRGGAIDASTLRRVLLLFETIFFAVALLGGAVMVASAPLGWLVSQFLSYGQAVFTEAR
jgi:O-antigen/teichoic acid export membrane protein